MKTLPVTVVDAPKPEIPDKNYITWILSFDRPRLFHQDIEQTAIDLLAQMIIIQIMREAQVSHLSKVKREFVDSYVNDINEHSKNIFDALLIVITKATGGSSIAH